MPSHYANFSKNAAESSRSAERGAQEALDRAAAGRDRASDRSQKERADAEAAKRDEDLKKLDDTKRTKDNAQAASDKRKDKSRAEQRAKAAAAQKLKSDREKAMKDPFTDKERDTIIGTLDQGTYINDGKVYNSDNVQIGELSKSFENDQSNTRTVGFKSFGAATERFSLSDVRQRISDRRRDTRGGVLKTGTRGVDPVQFGQQVADADRAKNTAVTQNDVNDSIRIDREALMGTKGKQKSGLGNKELFQNRISKGRRIKSGDLT